MPNLSITQYILGEDEEDGKGKVAQELVQLEVYWWDHSTKALTS